MEDFKVIITRNNFIVKEFEVHYTNYITAEDCAKGFLKINDLDDCDFHIFNI